MLDRTFHADHVRRRIRGNPIGAILERFIEHLVQCGYRRGTVHQYVFAAEHFGRWLGRGKLTHESIRQFLSKHLPSCRCAKPAVGNINCVRATLNRLREMLKIPVVSTGARSDPGTFSAQLLSSYQHHMSDVRGLAQATIHFRLGNAAAALAMFEARSAADIRALRPGDVTAFIRERIRGRSIGGSQVVTSATRSFLRFLLMRGLLTRDLAGVVLSPANWRAAVLPKVVDRGDLEKLVRTCRAGCQRDLAVERRDRAILLCLIDLGLRASDVAALRVEGVDVAGNALRLCRPKQRSTVVVPMTQRLSVAVQSYLRESRPTSKPDSGSRSEHVFITHRAPVGRAMTASGIRNVVRRRAVQAGLKDKIGGTHVIRHSVACTMLGSGASLKQIADLLGHRSIDTTSIYAKVDLGSLTRVAMPWPDLRGVHQREVTQ